jgi:hypothetical protein
MGFKEILKFCERGAATRRIENNDFQKLNKIKPQGSPVKIL